MSSHNFFSCYLTEGPNEHVHHATASDALDCCRQRIAALEMETVDRAWDISETARADERKKWEQAVGAANRGLQKVSRQLKLAMAALNNIKANGRVFETDVANAALREIESLNKAVKAAKEMWRCHGCGFEVADVDLGKHYVECGKLSAAQKRELLGIPSPDPEGAF